VPSEYVGAVIGKKGQTIRNITDDSKVSRYVHVDSAVYSINIASAIALFFHCRNIGVKLFNFSHCSFFCLAD